MYWLLTFLVTQRQGNASTAAPVSGQPDIRKVWTIGPPKSGPSPDTVIRCHRLLA